MKYAARLINHFVWMVHAVHVMNVISAVMEPMEHVADFVEVHLGRKDHVKEIHRRKYRIAKECTIRRIALLLRIRRMQRIVVH